MAGHSRWAQIKRQKGVTDVRRGKLFSKLSRHIMSAVRQGGGDPATNLKLQYAIDKAREYSMPKENVDRAIARASGTGGEGTALEEVIYEGYGPEGAAVVIELLTDNRNRAAQEVRLAVEKGGGTLAGAGAVAWNFEKKGTFWVDRAAASEEQVVEAALDAGADDVAAHEDGFEVACPPKAFTQVKGGLARKGIAVSRSEIGLVPKSVVELAPEAARRMEGLIEALEDLDDVQNVYTNHVAAASAAKESA